MKKNLLLFVFSVLFTLGLSAQKQYNYETVPGDMLNTRVYTLENGLKVYLSVYKDEPRIQTAIATRGGSKNDPADATGLAHYFEHMMFKGSNHFGTTDYAAEKAILDQIEQKFEEYRLLTDPEARKEMYRVIDSLSTEASKFAIPNEYDKLVSTIGASGTNAFTSLEQTVYINDIPSNQLENWLFIEADRFAQPVLRLFHTELETVYEEYNMTMASDSRKVNTAINQELFKKHPYGLQTVIGTPEHLKSPSMTRIKEFYAEQYVPNNMAICLSGDFDPDQVIILIDQYFGKWENQEVPAFTFEQEDPITAPITREVIGNDPEEVNIAFRLPGYGTKEADLLTMFDMLLTNGSVGLVDVNLNQTQMVNSASTYPQILQDYSVMYLTAKPNAGQTLEEAKNLLLEQIELIKKGDFEEWMLEAIINDFEYGEIKRLESSNARTMMMVQSFIMGDDWSLEVNKIQRLSKISKQDIIEFANQYFGDNYVVINKLQGKDKSIVKVKKPKITKININRDDKSDFFVELEEKAANAEDISPVFVDYDNDITKLSVKSILPLYYMENVENQTFSLTYVYDIGASTNKKLSLAISYLDYLGTKDKSSKQIKEEFYKLGLDYYLAPSSEEVVVSLRGLSKNLIEGVALLEELLSNPVVDQEAFDNLISTELKDREDAKKNPQAIFSQLLMYGMYEGLAPANDILTNEEINNLNAQELVDEILSLKNYEHTILFYGANEEEDVVNILNDLHNVADILLPSPKAKEYKIRDNQETKVFFVEADQRQAQILMLSKGVMNNTEITAPAKLYTDYFGSGMNSIIFQEMRESRALCYTAMAMYSNMLGKRNTPYFTISFIMTQPDKMQEALSAFYELLDNMPKAEASFEQAKSNIMQNLSTQRLTKESILRSYLSAIEMGYTVSPSQTLYEAIPNLTFEDVQKFQEEYIKGQEKNILVVGIEDDIDFKLLKKYGKVTKLKVEDIFPY